MKFAAIAGLAVVFVATSPAEKIAADRFHANADVVMINATVLDRHDRPVRGLTRDHFRVFEDRTEQSIAYFSEEETPLSLAIVFDLSGSMDRKVAGARQALDEVLKSANADDEFSLITFADAPEMALGWSPNPESIPSRLLAVSAHGQTSLLDAIETGLAELKKARHSRRAMLIFSDGGDNHSRATEREVLQSLAEAGVQIYAVDTAEPALSRARSPEEFAGPGLLERICGTAGGRYFAVDGRRELTAAAEQIARELRSQYLIEYVPSSSAKDGRFHHIHLRLKQGSPKLSVFWRRGYRSPGD